MAENTGILLQVVVFPCELDGQPAAAWMAEGVEIDYVAQADTWESAIRNFSEGISRTLDAIEESGASLGKSLLWDAATHRRDYMGLLKRACGPRRQVVREAAWPELPFSAVEYLVMSDEVKAQR